MNCQKALGGRPINNLLKKQDQYEVLKHHRLFKEIMSGFPLLIRVMTGMIPKYDSLAEFVHHFFES